MHHLVDAIDGESPLNDLFRDRQKETLETAHLFTEGEPSGTRVNKLFRIRVPPQHRIRQGFVVVVVVIVIIIVVVVVVFIFLVIFLIIILLFLLLVGFAIPADIDGVFLSFRIVALRKLLVGVGALIQVIKSRRRTRTILVVLLVVVGRHRYKGLIQCGQRNRQPRCVGLLQALFAQFAQAAGRATSLETRSGSIPALPLRSWFAILLGDT
mmetsp:Transcript_48126/g.121138  ORF Transcript_48126/g.121138 Transcript_48126/m.121138 type:complete len:211 (+) Transcript_48126:1527-2159(+)